MAVHSARSFRTGWITAATCSCLLAGGLARHPGAARAQSPVGQVEMWRGNTRVGAEPPPAAPAVATPALEQAGAPLPAIRGDTPWTPPPPISSLPTAPTPELRPVAAVKEAPPAANPDQLKEISQQLIRSTGQLATDCQSALDLCATSLWASGDRLVETLAVPVRAGREKAPATTTVVVTPAPAAERPAAAREDALPWYKVVWLQVVVGGSALVVGPLMVALMLGLMLRRSGLQFRVEVVNSPGALGQGVAYGVSRIDTSMPDVPARPVGRIEPGLGSLAALAAQEAVSFPAPEDEPAMTGEQFELGPSYEEERVAKEESLRLCEQAILQEIFEENLKLQEELRRQEEAALAAPATDEAPAVTSEPAANTVTDVVSEPIGYVTDEQGEAV
ncbi:MAG: hypothetical protein U0797_22405 [Gemmataceae bacterium]